MIATVPRPGNYSLHQWQFHISFACIQQPKRYSGKPLYTYLLNYLSSYEVSNTRIHLENEPA